MPVSRLRRHQERKLKLRMVWATLGTIGILLFIGIFGIKILEGYSLLADKLHPSLPQTNQSQVVIQPPILDPLPQATNSGGLTITGTGQTDLNLILYADDKEVKKVKIGTSGTFAIDYDVGDGKHTFSAKLSDDKSNLSDLSNVVETTVKKTKPNLDVTAPGDNTTVFGDTNTVLVTGKTDPETSVTVNNRFVVVKDDGSFSYTATLNEGDNTLSILATDTAGNQTTLTRKVTYHK